MATSSKPVCVRLTERQAKALLDHLKATVPASQSGLSLLETTHSAVLDAVCRVSAKKVTG